MLDLIWLIPLLPFIGFLINALYTGRIADAHARERTAGYVAVGAVGAAFIVAVLAFVQLGQLPEEARLHQVVLWTWIATGSLNVPFGLLLDPLAGVMVLLVTGWHADSYLLHRLYARRQACCPLLCLPEPVHHDDAVSSDGQ